MKERPCAASEIPVQLTDVLHREISAVKAADLAQVANLLEQKRALSAALQAAQPEFDALLRNEGPEAQKLRGDLADLYEAIRRNEMIVGRTIATLKEVATQILGDVNGQDLAGLYDSKGLKNNNKTGYSKAFDLSL